jgi:hypothetical protein
MNQYYDIHLVVTMKGFILPQCILLDENPSLSKSNANQHDDMTTERSLQLKNLSLKVYMLNGHFFDNQKSGPT